MSSVLTQWCQVVDHDVESIVLCARNHIQKDDGYISLHIHALTGKSCRMTHVKKRPPSKEAKSNLSEVSGFGISFTNSNNILVPGPSRN